MSMLSYQYPNFFTIFISINVIVLFQTINEYIINILRNILNFNSNQKHICLFYITFTVNPNFKPTSSLIINKIQDYII